MWIKNIIILLISTSAFCKPVSSPSPISVYQPGSGELQPQEYQQQYSQPIQYKQQLVQQGGPAPRALYKQQQQQQQQQHQDPRSLQQPESQDYENDPPQPYQFSFDVNDDENTNYQNRKEQREGNKISGSYSVVDSDGFIRTVTYTADPVEGFKAHVSREPTNIVVKVPTPHQSAGDSQGNVYSSPNSQAKQAGLQYNGAPVPRQPLPRLQQAVATAAPRHQPPQQYVQSPQDLIQYQPAYQGQTSFSHGQDSQAGQINQFLSAASPQGAHVNQYSDPNGHLRG